MYYLNDGNTNIDQKVEKLNSIKERLQHYFNLSLTFHEHIQPKINKAYIMLGLIKRNFQYVDRNTFILLYKSLVRPHLEYANSLWSPHKKGVIEDIEKIQTRATKLVISLKHLSYKQSLFYFILFAKTMLCSIDKVTTEY